MNKDRQGKLLKAINSIQRRDAAFAAADLNRYKAAKRQAEKDMKTALNCHDMEWYYRRKSAAAACDRLIETALNTIRKAEPAQNKSMSTTDVKTKVKRCLFK